MVTLAATPPLPLRHALRAAAADMPIIRMIERSCDSKQFRVGIRLSFFGGEDQQKTAKNGEEW